jgi:uncharacterized protein YndB with AHSA1/START domain
MLAVFGIIILAVLAVVAFAGSRPDTIEIQRNIFIDAPPEKVFALIDDFREWPKWQPQDRDDPTIQRSYGGTARGKGATSQWRGNNATGEGRQEIVQSTPTSLILVKADWVKPFELHNMNTFTFAPSREGTSLTWTMRGSNPFVARLMSAVIDMNKMMGKHFEDGLRNLKAAAEEKQ